jgi:hypothetical protein
VWKWRSRRVGSRESVRQKVVWLPDCVCALPSPFAPHASWLWYVQSECVGTEACGVAYRCSYRANLRGWVPHNRCDNDGPSVLLGPQPLRTARHWQQRSQYCIAHANHQHPEADTADVLRSRPHGVSDGLRGNLRVRSRHKVVRFCSGIFPCVCTSYCFTVLCYCSGQLGLGPSTDTLSLEAVLLPVRIYFPGEDVLSLVSPDTPLAAGAGYLSPPGNLLPSLCRRSAIVC